MGKRKSRAKPVAKKRTENLPTAFCCPFCNHASSVECAIDRKLSIGEASCSICQANFSTKINALSEPVDVYSEWIDECERANASAQEQEGDVVGDERFVTDAAHDIDEFFNECQREVRDSLPKHKRAKF